METARYKEMERTEAKETDVSGVTFVRSPSVRIHLLQHKVKHHLKFHDSYV